MDDVTSLPAREAPAAVPIRAAAASIGPSRIGWLSRSVWAVLFMIPSAVLVTAARLHPSPTGFGTHMQLGLPPCGFLAFTGVPCPGCGLTTAFANMVRLNVVAAAAANPFGIMLFFLTVACVPLSAVGFVRKWSVLDTLDWLRVDLWALLLAVCSVLTWLVRVAMTVLH